MTEMKKEVGNQVQLFIWRIPKKNHDAMVKLQKQFNDMNIKYGVLHIEVFQLTNIDTYDGCTNIFNTVSANQEEEICPLVLLYMLVGYLSNLYILLLSIFFFDRRVVLHTI
jgi:hypothetical protein